MSTPDEVFGQRHAETFPSTTAPDLPREAMPPIPSALLATPPPILKDSETAAMTAVAHALTPLDDEARKRVIGYAHTRFYPSGDIEGPRTFYLDDLPATGDLVHVDGEDVPVTDVRHVVDKGQLTWGLTASMEVTA